MDYLIERSSTGFTSLGNTKSIIGIITDLDIDNESVIFDKLKNIEEKYSSPNSSVKFVGLEPVFHHNREMRKEGPIAYEVVCIQSQKEDLINFKNTINLYRLTKIKRL